MKKLFSIFAVMFLALAPLSACEREEGVLEETGEQLDQTGEDIGESIEEGSEETFEE